VRGRPLLVLLTVLAALGAAGAQPALTVNGVEVPGATTVLVPGTAYAPAAGLARALGAGLDLDLATQRLTLALGARLVQLRMVDDPARATQVADAIRVDGAPREGPAAVLLGVEPFVPVKASAEALGARVSFLPERNQVLVVSPRPTVTAGLVGSGATERLILRASSPTRVTSFFSETVQTLQLRFERSDVSAAQSFSGDGFVRADVLGTRGDVDVRVQLAPDRRVTWTELPDGEGFVVVVGFAPAAPGGVTTVAASERPRIVLDPAMGSGPGAAAAGELTLAATQVMAQRLERAGFDVELTRSGQGLPSVTERSALGAGSRLFLTLQAADLPAGSLRLYHLGDAADLRALEDAVRFNAETVLARQDTDGVRRQVLLDLVVDLALGARYAEALAAELRQAGGYQVEPPRAAPVAVLTGAAGRGLLLEASAQDLRDPGFATQLAATVATVVASGGLLP
jgi:N-acetylmuramoyl-L-alanine amidase